ncbi:Fc.00g046170.m01.CDS01 [Cosmosporella sp. VM-42]
MASPKHTHKMEDAGIMNLGRSESYAAGDSQAAGDVSQRRTETHRGIKSRHAQMIAIGGTIATSLFVGSGQVLAVTGPANLFIGYVVLCFFIYGIMTATSEVSSVPSSSMASYATRFVSKSLGFAMGVSLLVFFCYPRCV